MEFRDLLSGKPPGLSQLSAGEIHRLTTPGEVPWWPLLIQGGISERTYVPRCRGQNTTGCYLFGSPGALNNFRQYLFYRASPSGMLP
jgi:hypothetical protein